MNYLKDFLKALTKNNAYYAEMVDNMAEVYIDKEAGPIALIEFDGSMYHINFRCDMTSQVVAHVTYDMTMIDEDIVIGQDFYSTPEDGVVYGEQALALYFSSILQAFETAQIKQEAELDDSIYLVKEPIYAYGNKKQYKNKLQRLWGTDLE